MPYLIFTTLEGIYSSEVPLIHFTGKTVQVNVVEVQIKSQKTEKSIRKMISRLSLI